MTTTRVGRRGLLPMVAIGIGLFPMLGCGGPVFDCVPVSGTVSLDGKPLEGGYLVVYSPDPSKGNTTRAACLGKVNNGHYEVASTGVTRTEKGSGAPRGWYKVILEPVGSSSNPFRDKSANQLKVGVHSMYLSLEKTPLEIEVNDDPKPGAYDLHLKSR